MEASVYAVLRELCYDFGDRNWTEETPLVEVLETHLGEHLYDMDTALVRWIEQHGGKLSPEAVAAFHAIRNANAKKDKKINKAAPP